ncbi:MAG: Fic family protein, partial [Planctomycetes bacterium]|nr:Fic family protein [Planctomycetota bacterium]
MAKGKKAKSHTKRHLPWYREHDFWVGKAVDYQKAMPALGPRSEQQAEVFRFAKFNEAGIIFESNLIEGAGLSEGETRKVVERFPDLPRSYLEFRAFLEGGESLEKVVSAETLKRMSDAVIKHGLALKRVRPTVRFAGKSREFLEVHRHYQSMREAFAMVLVYVVKRKMAVMPKAPRPINLLTLTKVKHLHRILARDLLPSDCGVPAGHYRVDDRAVGWDILFPSPELVPECMRQFTVRSRNTMNRVRAGEMSVFEAAARISYDFVRIHPFPDFNGRLSRLLMNMVLMAGGCPVSISLRADKQGRRRYFLSLRHANRGNMKPLTTLIAMRYVETCEEIDNNLRLAGKQTILEFAKTKEKEAK